MSTITKLTTENVKRIKAVAVEPDGSLVVVGGRNSQGKSSLLDSIEAALGGKAACPDVAIRDGARKGRVVVETDDLVVTRTFTASGTSLKVTAKDGSAVKSPQRLLDGLVGPLSFDPLAFSRMKPAEQASALRGLVGLDFSELDKKEAEASELRAILGREGKAQAALVGQLPYHEDAPQDEVSVVNLVDEFAQAQRVVAENNAARSRLSEARSDVDRLRKEAKDMSERLDQATARLDKAVEAHSRTEQLVGELVDPDIDGIKARLENAEQVNDAVRNNKAHAQASELLRKQRAEYSDVTDTIEGLRKQRQDAIAAADYPVDGLTVTEDGVQLHGLPFSQASSSEQLRCSVAMGLAVNPGLKILLVRDGSLLDTDSLRTVAEMAESAGGQVWIERVSEGEEVSVLIEDGMVLQSAAEQKPAIPAPEPREKTAPPAMSATGEELLEGVATIGTPSEFDSMVAAMGSALINGAEREIIRDAMRNKWVELKARSEDGGEPGADG
jgi:hypothetical protein